MSPRRAPAWAAIPPLVFLYACGGAPAQPEAPMAPGAAPASMVSSGSPEDAAAELARAEQELTSALGGRRLGASEEKEGPKAPGADSAAPMTSGDPCQIACSALGSMQRATDHLCELAGEGDERCTNARDRVRSATDLVHERCPSCS